MKIPDLDTAETVVSKNPELSWDGWNVVQKTQDDSAQFNVNGVYDRITGKWYIKKTYSLDCDEGCWTIPDEAIVE